MGVFISKRHPHLSKKQITILKKIYNFLSMNAIPRGKSRYYNRLKWTRIWQNRKLHLRTPHRFPHPPQQPQSTHSSRTITIPQMTTVPTDATRRVLMQQVEPHRHSGTCRCFSKWCNQTTGWARHHFQKSETYFEITLGRKPVGVHHGQRDRWTRKGNGVKWDG
mgnify:CR=1 FL=1